MVFNCNTNQLFHENAQKKKAVGQIDQRLSLNNERMNGFWLKYRTCAIITCSWLQTDYKPPYIEAEFSEKTSPWNNVFDLQKVGKKYTNRRL